MTKQNLQCPFCPKTSSRGTGLASHIRGAHPAQYSTWSKGHKSASNAGIGVTRSAGTAGGFKDIIGQLERRRTAIERAVAALRQMEGIATPDAGSENVQLQAPGKVRPKRRLTPEGRARLVAALKRRWAERKAAGK